MAAAKTAAERQRARRERRAALGLVRVEVFVHPDDAAAVRRLAARMTVARMKAKEGKPGG